MASLGCMFDRLVTFIPPEVHVILIYGLKCGWLSQMANISLFQFYRSCLKGFGLENRPLLKRRKSVPIRQQILSQQITCVQSKVLGKSFVVVVVNVIPLASTCTPEHWFSEWGAGMRTWVQLPHRLKSWVPWRAPSGGGGGQADPRTSLARHLAERLSARFGLKNQCGGKGEMAQWVKALAVKLNDLASILRIHVVDREN